MVQHLLVPSDCSKFRKFNALVNKPWFTDEQVETGVGANSADVAGKC